MPPQSWRRRRLRREAEQAQKRQDQRVNTADIEHEKVQAETAPQSIMTPASSDESVLEMPDFEDALNVLFDQTRDEDIIIVTHGEVDRTAARSGCTLEPFAIHNTLGRSFFALPAEVRIRIYTFVCTTWLKYAPVLPGTTSDSRTIVPASFAKQRDWTMYSKSLTALQLTNAQFGANSPLYRENIPFSAFWSRTSRSVK